MNDNERMNDSRTEDDFETVTDYEGTFNATSAGEASFGTGGEPRTPEEIEREIEATRSRMTRDIDALGNKLKPSNLAHSAGDAIATRAEKTGRGLLDLVRDNPLPAAAVGASVAWLVASSRSESGSNRRYSGQYESGNRRTSQYRGGSSNDFRNHYDDDQGEGRIGQAKHKVGDAVSGTANTVSEKAHDIGEKAHELTDRAKDWTQHAGQDVGREVGRVRQVLDRQTHENPLLVAAGAMVLGVALGFLLPGTRKENELMGSASDQVTDRAEETIDRVKDVATEGAKHVAETVKSEVQAHAPEMKEMARDIGQHVKDQAKGVATEVASEAKATVQKGKNAGGTGVMGGTTA
ncbi:MAG: DUF3618 domain-containing protein [Gemmatimonadales bacterium]|nr:DUF3618 domain-containing protein [Gemmatimonadales bacterium]